MKTEFVQRSELDITTLSPNDLLRTYLIPRNDRPSREGIDGLLQYKPLTQPAVQSLFNIRDAARVRSNSQNLTEGEIAHANSLTNTSETIAQLTNLGLVVVMAGKLVGRNDYDLFEDSVADGILGLEEAVAKYDVQRGFRFSTHARWWILRTMRIGRAYKDRFDKHQAIVVSLDAPLHDDNESHTLASMLPSSNPLTEDVAVSNVMKGKIHKAIGQLTEKQKHVITHLFGIGAPEQMYEEVAKETGTTLTAVWKKKQAAEKKLRIILEGEIS